MYIPQRFSPHHLTCNLLLHHPVKVENPNMLLILTASSHVNMFRGHFEDLV